MSFVEQLFSLNEKHTVVTRGFSPGIDAVLMPFLISAHRFAQRRRRRRQEAATKISRSRALRIIASCSRNARTAVSCADATTKPVSERPVSSAAPDKRAFRSSVMRASKRAVFPEEPAGIMARSSDSRCTSNCRTCEGLCACCISKSIVEKTGRSSRSPCVSSGIRVS